MKRVALVFVVAVLVPSLLLGWLAARSLRDQQYIVEHQQSLLYQSVTEATLKEINGYLSDLRRDFGSHVDSLLAQSKPLEVAQNFDERLRALWPYAEVAFSVSLQGTVISPSLLGTPEARRFRLENDRFLCNVESLEVYWNTLKKTSNAVENEQNASSSAYWQSQAQSPRDSKGYPQKLQLRNVAPRNDADNLESNSKVVAAETEFRQLVGDATSGFIARFSQNQLKVLTWHRPSREPQIVFGAQLDLRRVVRDIADVLPRGLLGFSDITNEVVLAVLNDAGRPVAVSRPGYVTDWKHPFVASEVGETLPHWEVAAYLLNPAKLNESARLIRLTLGLLVIVLLVAIFVGSWLIVADLKRQLELARQKTDFVSNVSHELKTPLTSIRMFSELLAEERVVDRDKQRSYLGIIHAETARLTRLINNVLDFARMERGEKQYHFTAVDLVEIVSETVASYRPHLESAGFSLEISLPEESMQCRADRDAIAQVLLNLLSNAEKYSPERKELFVELKKNAGGDAELSVMDRGMGVPDNDREKIFEQFYRAHDSLGSGIQGSGLGLTLARQIARTHGGDISHRPREGGGSCFVVILKTLFA
jgi:signal transduction histidine kinase